MLRFTTTLLRVLIATSCAHAMAQSTTEGTEDWSNTMGGPVSEKPVVQEPPIHVREWLILKGHENPEALVMRYLLLEAEPPVENEPLTAANLFVWKRGAAKPCTLAYAQLQSKKGEVRMAQLTGARTLYVNGEPFIGVSKARGERGVPVYLKPGVNHLFVLEATDDFELEFWKPTSEKVVATWKATPKWFPRSGSPYYGDLHVPVFNATLQNVDFLHLHYSDPTPDDGKRTWSPHEWADARKIAPLCLSSPRLMCLPDYELYERDFQTAPAANVSIAAFEYTDQSAARVIFSIPFSERKEWKPPPEAYRLWNVWTNQKTVFVCGTKGTQAENAASLARARYDQQFITIHSVEVPAVWTDEQYLDVLNGKYNWAEYRRVALYGNRDTNAAWLPLVGSDSAIQVERGKLKLPHATHEGDDLFGTLIVPRVDGTRNQDTVILVADTGVLGARAGAFRGAARRGVEAGTFLRLDENGRAIKVDEAAPR